MQGALGGDSSSSSDDNSWLLSPVGPLTLVPMQQEALLETSTLAVAALMRTNYKRRRLNRSGGSRPGRSPNIDRSFGEFYDRFMKYYFVERLRFNDRAFWQRFRYRKALFIAAVDKISAHDEYFQQNPDATGRLGLTPLHKIIVAWRKICYGFGNDSMDENFEVAASTNRHILDHFCDASIALWEKEFIRRPTAADIERISTDVATSDLRFISSD